MIINGRLMVINVKKERNEDFSDWSEGFRW